MTIFWRTFLNRVACVSTWANVIAMRFRGFDVVCKIIYLHLPADAIFDRVHGLTVLRIILKVHESWNWGGDIGSDSGGGSCRWSSLSGVTSTGCDVIVGIDGVSASSGVNVNSVVLSWWWCRLSSSHNDFFKFFNNNYYFDRIAFLNITKKS